MLVKQPELLYEALSDLEEERPGVTDLYFVGFASYAAEDVFRKDMDVARDLFDSRFDTDGRSVVLINNPRTVLDEPLATVSNLRASLSVIGDLIDRDQDVVMIYLTSHGSRDHRLSVDFPPLELDPARARRPASRCSTTPGSSGASSSSRRAIPAASSIALKDDYTLIMTASAADRTSFGCGTESDATYFGDALFQHALRFEDSFVKAFQNARERIAEREKSEHRQAFRAADVRRQRDGGEAAEAGSGAALHVAPARSI